MRCVTKSQQRCLPAHSHSLFHARFNFAPSCYICVHFAIFWCSCQVFSLNKSFNTLFNDHGTWEESCLQLLGYLKAKTHKTNWSPTNTSPKKHFWIQWNWTCWWSYFTSPTKTTDITVILRWSQNEVYIKTLFTLTLVSVSYEMKSDLILDYIISLGSYVNLTWVNNNNNNKNTISNIIASKFSKHLWKTYFYFMTPSKIWINVCV